MVSSALCWKGFIIFQHSEGAQKLRCQQMVLLSYDAVFSRLIFHLYGNSVPDSNCQVFFCHRSEFEILWKVFFFQPSLWILEQKLFFFEGSHYAYRWLSFQLLLFMRNTFRKTRTFSFSTILTSKFRHIKKCTFFWCFCNKILIKSKRGFVGKKERNLQVINEFFWVGLWQ